MTILNEHPAAWLSLIQIRLVRVKHQRVTSEVEDTITVACCLLSRPIIFIHYCDDV